MTNSKNIVSFILCGFLQLLTYHAGICEAQTALSCQKNSVENDECFLRNKMYRIVNGECQETCALVPYVAKMRGWKCGPCISPPITSPISTVAPVQGPIKVPIQSPVKVPVPPPTTTTGSKKCGGAVNTGGGSANATCLSDLWNPTQDRSMHCYAYGGVSDPCALHNNNDLDDGLFKSPARCDRDTFYLWDEVRIRIIFTNNTMLVHSSVLMNSLYCGTF
jgi:hypothetical protein